MRSQIYKVYRTLTRYFPDFYGGLKDRLDSVTTSSTAGLHRLNSRVSLAYPRQHAHPPVGLASLRRDIGVLLQLFDSSRDIALVVYTGLAVVVQVLFLVW